MGQREFTSLAWTAKLSQRTETSKRGAYSHWTSAQTNLWLEYGLKTSFPFTVSVKTRSYEYSVCGCAFVFFFVMCKCAFRARKMRKILHSEGILPRYNRLVQSLQSGVTTSSSFFFKVFDDLGHPKRRYSTTWERDLTISCVTHCTFNVLIQIGQKPLLKNTKRKVQYVQTARFLNPVKHILRLEHSIQPQSTEFFLMMCLDPVLRVGFVTYKASLLFLLQSSCCHLFRCCSLP